MVGVRARLSLLLALTVAAGAHVSGPAVVLADPDPVTERAEVTYRLDPARGRIDATAVVRFTNRIPVQRLGNRVRRFYLERWGPIAVPVDARAIKVRPRSVRVRRIPTGGAYDNLVFSFPRIFNGGSVSFTLTWTIPAGEGGSTSGTVVSDAYSHVCWTGQPVDRGPIVLVIPRDLEAVTQGSRVRTTRKGTLLRISARARDLGTFYACTDVYDPSLLVRRDLVSPRGHSVSVEGLPGNDAWLETTSRDIAEALAGVETVVGAPLPGDDPIRVREVPAQALQGYAGDFDPRSGVVRVGDQGASVALLSHELSHAWFNASTLADNWLWEGYAEWASRATVGTSCDRPVGPPLQGAPRLSDWKVLTGAEASFEDQQVVEWQYETACAIQGRVAAAIGPDRMRQVIAVLLAGDSPYDLLPDAGDASPPGESDAPASAMAQPSPTAPPRVPPGGRRPTSSTSTATPAVTPGVRGLSPTRSSGRRSRPVDWRQWLDIVDEVGLMPAGVTDATFAQDLLVETGVTRRRAVRGRAEARGAYHELQRWTPSGVTPVVVRRSLDAWDFDTAMRDIRLADQVARLIAMTPEPSTEVRALWATYEGATSREALRHLRDRLSGAATVPTRAGSGTTAQDPG